MYLFWRAVRVREAAVRLVKAGEVVIMQKGAILQDLTSTAQIKGPIRLRLA